MSNQNSKTEDNGSRNLEVRKEPRILDLPLCGHKLTFKPKVDVPTYVKMKQDTQKLLIDGKTQKGEMNLPKGYDYFTDLCIKIEDADGKPVAVNRLYLDNLEVEDFYLIDQLCEELISLQLGKSKAD